jgi:hypothetical protein
VEFLWTAGPASTRAVDLWTGRDNIERRAHASPHRAAGRKRLLGSGFEIDPTSNPQIHSAYYCYWMMDFYCSRLKRGVRISKRTAGAVLAARSDLTR